MGNLANDGQLLEKWRATRLEDLTAEDGWLNIIGRWEVDQKTISIGSAQNCDIVLDNGPDVLGTIEFLDEVTLVWQMTGHDPITIVYGPNGWPKQDALNFVIEITLTGSVRAIRIRDRHSKNREKLKSIPHYDYDASWQMVADWIKLETPEMMAIKTSLGHEIEVEVTHKARFLFQGEHRELLATFGTPDRPQFVFRDQTCGQQSYEKARFLFGENVTENTILLNFNKTVNPPCALTQFATCPLPPAQNVLDIAVEAGEKRFEL